MTSELDDQRNLQPESDNTSASNDAKQTKKPGLISEVIKTWLPAVLAFLFFRGAIAEARYIPSGSMLPTLQINDRVIIEKVTGRLFHRPVERGDILVFYPPKVETGMSDENSILNLLPFIPEHPPAFIKRVVGLAGDTIEVRKGVGIFVNGKQVVEASDIAKPDYEIKRLRDIGGIAMTGAYVQPYGESNAPIVVPPNSLFMMGDNHNNSGDSHVWGFLDDKRVVGRVCCTFWHAQWLSGIFPKK